MRHGTGTRGNEGGLAMTGGERCDGILEPFTRQNPWSPGEQEVGRTMSETLSSGLEPDSFDVKG